MLMGPISALLMNLAEVFCVSVGKSCAVCALVVVSSVCRPLFFLPRGEAELFRADVFYPDADDSA